MMDALRLLPVLGGMLWMLPLFWRASPAEGAEGVPMSNAVIYVFLVWFLLIGASYVLWRGLWRNRLPDDEDEDAP